MKRNEFLLVFLVKPTDTDCLDYKESAMIQPGKRFNLGLFEIVFVCLFSRCCGCAKSEKYNSYLAFNGLLYELNRLIYGKFRFSIL